MARLTQEQYETIQHQLLLIGELLVQMDLPAFLEQIETAETVGPILDPTLYRMGMSNMAEVKRLAKAAMELREVRAEQLAKEKEH